MSERASERQLSTTRAAPRSPAMEAAAAMEEPLLAAVDEEECVGGA
jgi:hypothetical protein